MEVFLLFVGLGLFSFLILAGLALYEISKKINFFEDDE